MEVSRPRWWRRPGVALTGGVVGSLLLAACGGSSTGSTTQTLASENKSQCTFACHAATWSPDGARLAYADGDQMRVYTMRSDDGTDAVKRFSFATPLLITVHGRRQVISQGSGLVGAYDPQTGREIWRVRYPGYSVVPRPVFGHGLLFVCTGFDAPSLLAIRPDGEGDVTASHVAWTLKKRSASIKP